MAAMRKGDLVNQFDFTDCTAMDFSTDTGDDDGVAVLISRSTTFPCTASKKFKTMFNDQEFLDV